MAYRNLSMGTKRKYWKSQEQLLETPEFIETQSKEFSEDLPMEQFLGSNDLDATSTSRRDFLKFFGFSVAAATLAACEAPVVKSIPYVNKPEDVTPGVANWYASTYYDGTDFGSVLVKQREGRPIHIKGNKYFGINNGAINARISSSVLSLYDSERLRNPLKAGQDSSWATLDSEVSAKLKSVDVAGKKVVLLTNSIISPSTSKVVDGFSKQFSNFEHVSFDSISAAAIRLANEESFGNAFIPSYDFSKAKTILSFSADFLSTWLLANVNVSQYAKSRNPENAWMSKHYQVEADLSLTGSNADVRVPVTPTEEYQAVLYVYNTLASKLGVAKVAANDSILSANAKSKLNKAVADLLVSKNESLVVAGSNNKDVQVLVNSINSLLGTYNTTIDVTKPVYIKKGLDHKVVELVKEMNAGKVGALLVSGVNPSYNLPNATAFNTGLSKVDLKVSFALYNDETASQFDYVAPDNHYLESWNDLEPVAGEYSLVQPIIRSLYDTRQFQDTLLAWSGSTVSYYDLLKNNWSETLVSNQSKYTSSTDFWNYSVHNGSASLKVEVETLDVSENKADVKASASALNAIKSSGLEVVVYAKTGLGDGSHANNPWLQELPDPISKVTWDNYIAMNPSDMKKEEFNFNIDYDQEKPLSLATITVNNHTVTLPVYPSYGQKSGTVSVAMGYGRGANGEKVGNAAFVTKEYGGFEYDENENRIPVGKNVIPFIQFNGKTFVNNASNATIEATGDVYKIASTQIHHTIMDRDSVVRETTFEIYDANRDNKEAYNPAHTLSVWDKDEKNGEGAFVNKPIKEVDLWDDHPVENVGHRWGMTIDLISCIGCGTCLVACQV